MKQLLVILAAVAGVAMAALAGNPDVTFGAWARVNQLATEASVPRVYTISNSAATMVFGTNGEAQAGRTIVRVIQNTGTNPVYFVLGSTNVPLSLRTNISPTNYHGILAGGQSMRDGLGSVGNFSHTWFPIYLRSVTNTTEVSVIELTQ